MLNLERLRVLASVASTGSVVGAARILHVTTSAVSQQLARLEREIGQSLVERHGRGIRLTDAGVKLAGYAVELLEQAERAEAGMAAQRGDVGGRLVVAAFATAVRGLLPDVVSELSDRHPDLSISLTEQEPDAAVPALSRGDIDVALVQDWPDHGLEAAGSLARQHLFEDIYDFAVPVEHRLADRDSVTLAELADEPWISWSDGQFCHSWLIAALGRPRIVHTAAEHATQLALVAAGLGVAIVPRLGREPVPSSVAFVTVDPPPVRRIDVLWRASSVQRPAVAVFLAEIRRRYADGRPG